MIGGSLMRSSGSGGSGQLSTVPVRGLVNLGQTCYLNAVLQALLHTPYLHRYFLLAPLVNCQLRHGLSQKPCLITELFRVYREYYNGFPEPQSLDQLASLVFENLPHFQPDEQQDAHELFTGILTAIDLHFSGDFSLTEDIFKGRLKSTVTCNSCGNRSVTFDPFRHISLPLSDLSLEDILRRYTQVEACDEPVECLPCQRKTESRKQLQLQNLPPVLVLHLNRFQQRRYGGRLNKIGSHVQFPEQLDLSSFVPQQKEISNYQLYAVVCHSGRSIHLGHYIAFVKPNRKQVWVKCDDIRVTPVEREEVLAAQAYLLFYRRDD